MKQEGRELRGIGHEVALVGQQRLQLRRQQLIALTSLPGLLQIDHGCTSSKRWPTQLRANW